MARFNYWKEQVSRVVEVGIDLSNYFSKSPKLTKKKYTYTIIVIFA